MPTHKKSDPPLLQVLSAAHSLPSTCWSHKDTQAFRNPYKSHSSDLLTTSKHGSSGCHNDCCIRSTYFAGPKFVWPSHSVGVLLSQRRNPLSCALLLSDLWKPRRSQTLGSEGAPFNSETQLFTSRLVTLTSCLKALETWCV